MLFADYIYIYYMYIHSIYFFYYFFISFIIYIIPHITLSFQVYLLERICLFSFIIKSILGVSVLFPHHMWKLVHAEYWARIGF